MREITEEDLIDLEGVISNATPGPWYISDDQICTQALAGYAPVMEERKNIHYASVFDPEVTEGLLALIRSRGEQVEGLVLAVGLLSKMLTEKEDALIAAHKELTRLKGVS